MSDKTVYTLQIMDCNIKIKPPLILTHLSIDNDILTNIDKIKGNNPSTHLINFIEITDNYKSCDLCLKTVKIIVKYSMISVCYSCYKFKLKHLIKKTNLFNHNINIEGFYCKNGFGFISIK